MTTSGAYAYSPDVAEILTEAWERTGGDPEKLTVQQARSARRSLQLLLLGWSTRTINLWQVDKQTVSTVIGTNTITTATATLDILEAYVTSSSIDQTLTPIGRDEFVSIPNKTSQAKPTQFWLERTLPLPIIHLYPTPDAVYSFTYYRIRQPQDVTGAGQTLDVATVWLEAVHAELAARLAVKYAPDKLPMLQALARDAFDAADQFGQERVNMRLSLRFGR